MDIINIDGKQYDPYFILEVTKQDSDEAITKSFKEKVKKYHPDKYTDIDKKKKYEQYFKILNESYQYIKKKRKSTIERKRNPDVNNKNIKNKTMNKQDLQKFNKEYEQKQDVNRKKSKFEIETDSKNNKSSKEKIEDYNNFEVNVYNQFSGKRFCNKTFNEMFDYNKKENEQNQDEYIKKSLIHRTTDGFNAYNSAEFGNCALVSTFRGLMISGDYLAETGNGFWGDKYGDYKYSYSTARNPNSKIIIKHKNKKDYNVDVISKATNIKEKPNDKQFDEIIYEDLLEKENQDKEIVERYISQYDENTISKALSGELETSDTYKEVLHKLLIG